MTVKVTLPDGTTTTLGPFTADDTGGTHTEYTPTGVGTYTFQMSFTGQILAGNNPPPTGFTAIQKEFIGDYYLPATSNIATLTVQTAVSRRSHACSASNKLLADPSNRNER